jgi:hypothetical protein
MSPQTSVFYWFCWHASPGRAACPLQGVNLFLSLSSLPHALHSHFYTPCPSAGCPRLAFLIGFAGVSSSVSAGLLPVLSPYFCRVFLVFSEVWESLIDGLFGCHFSYFTSEKGDDLEAHLSVYM